MRVISGQWKGLKLECGRFKEVRPLTGRIKESLFGILGETVQNATVLDLFAGTGSFGIEALSRGAQHVVFFEKTAEVVALIRKNLDKTKCEKTKYQIFRSDVFKNVHKFLDREVKFDIIFVDPPFNIQVSKRIFDSLSNDDLLNRKGILIYRNFIKELMPQMVGIFKLVRSKKYGDSSVKFYEKVGSNENRDLSGNF